MNGGNVDAGIWAALGTAFITLLGYLIQRFSPQFQSEQARWQQQVESDLWERVQRELQAQGTEIQALRVENGELRNRVTTLETDHRATLERAEQAEAERDTALDRADSAEAERDELKQQIAEDKASWNADRKQLHSEIADLRSEIADLREEMQRLERKRSALPRAPGEETPDA